MLTLLISLLILALIVWVIHIIIGMLSLPEPVKTIAYIIVAVVVLIVLLRQLGVWV